MGIYWGDTDTQVICAREASLSRPQETTEIDPFPYTKAVSLMKDLGIHIVEDGFGDSGEHIIDRDGTTAIWWCIEGIRLTDNSRGFFTIFSHLPGKVLETENCPSFVLEYIHNNLNDNSH